MGGPEPPIQRSRELQPEKHLLWMAGLDPAMEEEKKKARIAPGLFLF
jgi:hypothetical protein